MTMKIWGQKQNNGIVQRLKKFQEKAVCLINFETNSNVVGQLFKDSNILKLTEFIKYKYALFIRNSLRKENILIFNRVYTLFNQNHKVIDKADAICTTNSNCLLQGTFI